MEIQNSNSNFWSNVERLTSNVANASKREQRLLADYAEREHFRADVVWSNVANASKRGQRLLADYAEREHFRTDVVWSNVAGAPMLEPPRIY